MNGFFVWFCFFVRLRPPERETLDEYMDYLVPKIRYFGEDLVEEHFYVGSRWREFQPDGESVVLHIFQPSDAPGGEYLKVTDGDVSEGEWSYMKGNKMVLQHPNQELFELGFLNPYLFIIRKHGTHHNKDRSKYLVLVSSGLGGMLERALGTREVSLETIAELMYHYYMFNNSVTGFLVVVLPLVVLILFILL